jgi:hypothetical protein
MYLSLLLLFYRSNLQYDTGREGLLHFADEIANFFMNENISSHFLCPDKSWYGLSASMTRRARGLMAAALTRLPVPSVDT